MKSKSGGKFVIALIIAYLLLPLALTLTYSLFTEWMDILPSGFTLRYYAEIFADPIFWASLARTVVISFIPVFITAVVLLLCYIYFQIPLATLLLIPAFDGLKKEWREAVALLGGSETVYWLKVGLPNLLPSILGTFSVLFANAVAAYATAYARGPFVSSNST